MFKDLERRYRQEGAKSFKLEIASMIDQALTSDASQGFMCLVHDICMDLGMCSEAIRILDEETRRFGANDVLFNNLAYCLSEKGELNAAYAAYKNSLALNPSNVSSLRGAAFLAIETDHDHEAVRLCRKFYVQSAESGEAAIWYATALYNTDRVNALREFVRRHCDSHGPDKELESFLE